MMGKNRKLWLVGALCIIVMLLLSMAGLVSCRQPVSQQESSTGFDSLNLSGNLVVAVPTNVGTATPGIYVNNRGLGNAIDIQDGGTPAWSVGPSGNVASTGNQVIGGNVKITGPTAGATATPALIVDSLAAGANLLEVRDAATPVFAVENGGDFVVGPADGTGVDIYFWSDTAGDYLKWDQVNEKLIIIGTNAATALDVQDGNVIVNDDLTVTAGSFTVTAGAVTFGTDGTAADVIFYSDTAGDNLTWSQANEKLTVTGTNAATALDVADGNLLVNDDVTVTAGNVLVTAGTVTFGATGAANDVIFYSDTAGDLFQWTAADEKLTITGTDTQTALDVADGNVIVNDNLTVSGGAFDVTAGATTLEALTIGVDGTGADVIFFSGTAGDNLTWSSADEKLTVTGTNAQTALDVADGNVVINDSLTVTAGALAVTAGTSTLGGDVTITAIPGGGNQGGAYELAGLVRISLTGLAAGTNPAADTVAEMDTTPTGEWVEVDAGTNLVVTADTGYYRDSTNSIKMAFTDVVDNDGIDGTIVQKDLSTLDGLGFWIYSSVPITANWFDVTLDDTNGTDQTYNVATAVAATTWTWVEVDISGCDANCDTTDGIQILATTAGGTGLAAADVYIDAVYVWDAADEEVFGDNILRDGLLSVVDGATGVNLVEWTNYIVRDIEAANTRLVWVTDTSLLLGILALYVY